MKNNMRLSVPVSTGVEASVKRQLVKLGYGDCPAVNGRISLEGGWEDVARLNVFLRSGERVLLQLAEFPARTFDDIFEGIGRIPWENFMTAHSRILLDGKCVKSDLMAVKATGGVVKKAIIMRLKDRLGVRTLDEKGERFLVGFSLFENVCTVTLDTSGDGLHKRGYRTLNYDAPLRETLAAALVDHTFFRAEKPLADLFCGSGTLPIEAAMIARNIAPGKNRSFDFIRWKCVPDVMKPVLEEAADTEQRIGTEIYGCDINPKAVAAARYHAQRAGVADGICFEQADMRSFQSAESFGILLSNPPYGERMGEECDLERLYCDFSKVFRRLDSWSCFFITSFAGAQRAFGKKADKNRKLYNANLECYFYSYFGKKPPKA